MEGILDSSSSGWRRSNMILFIGEPTGCWREVWKGSWTPVLVAGEGLYELVLLENQQAAGEKYGRDPGLQFYWLEKV